MCPGLPALPRVVLHLGSTLWADHLQLLVRQATIATYVSAFDPPAELIATGLAVSHPAHLAALHTLATEAGTSLTMGEAEERVVEEEVEQLRTAFLPIGNILHVYMTECLSPQHFYLASVANMASLEELEREVGRVAEEQRFPKFAFTPEIGQVVMVRPGLDEGWVRGRVVARLGPKQKGEGEEARVEEVVRVFCLDTGETVEVGGGGVGALPAALATRIPAQAVRCRLEGAGEGSADTLWELSRERSTDQPKVLTCRALAREAGEYTVRLGDHEKGGVGDFAKVLVRGEVVELSPESGGEREGWEAPFGLPDVLDMTEVRAATTARCRSMLDERAVVAKPKPSLPSTPVVTPLPPPLSLPTDLPPLRVVAGVEKKVPAVKWRQDATSLTLTLEVAAVTDLVPEQVHLCLQGRRLQVQVLQVVGRDRGDINLTDTGPLTLWGEVVVGRTEVKVAGPRLTVLLKKARPAAWPRVVTQRFGWVRRDAAAVGESEEEEDEAPRPGFLAPYLGEAAAGPRYHRETGETVLPEQVARRGRDSASKSGPPAENFVQSPFKEKCQALQISPVLTPFLTLFRPYLAKISTNKNIN